MPPGPVHVISDLHLGHFASKIHDPAQVEHLFDGAASVVLAGDTSEQHLPELAERAGQLRARLVESIRAHGAGVVELPGNHDPAVSPFTHVELAGGRVLVHHGDALFHYGSPWGREVVPSRPDLERVTAAFGPAAALDAEGWMARANAWARAMSPPETLEFESLRGRLGHYAGLLFPPQRVAQMANAVLTGELRALRLAERFFPRARFIVNGHTHLGRIVPGRGRVAINTGAYVRIGSPRLVIVEADRLRVLRVAQRGDLFVPGREIAGWPLAAD